MELRIDDPDPDGVGEVWGRCGHSFLVDAEGWQHTGGLGRLVDGYLYLIGRKGDKIIRGGENVFPVEVEQVLESHPGVVLRCSGVMPGRRHDAGPDCLTEPLIGHADYGRFSHARLARKAGRVQGPRAVGVHEHVAAQRRRQDPAPSTRRVGQRVGVPVDSSLRGIRVLDLSRILAAPWASQLLGDLGAEVVKVKRPRIGDEARGYGPPFPAALHHRDVHSGEGQYIDASLLECGVPALSHYAQNFLISGVC